METVAIFGATGAIGVHVAAELKVRKMSAVVVGRSESRLRTAFAEGEGLVRRTADLSSPEGARAACDGVHSIVYSVGAPYDQFQLHPVMMRNTVNAAREAGVRRLIVISSVYSYGAPRTPRVAEDHPREPVTRKGKFRREQEEIAMSAQASGDLECIVLHLPDFLGPHAEQSFSTLLFRSALANQTANWLGDPGLPHEFIYVPDVAPVVVDLVQRDDVWGEHYNLAGFGAITGTEFLDQIYSAASRRPRYRSVGRPMLHLLGLFNPLMRELVEMSYLQETPVILDDSKLQLKLGPITKTPYANAITATVAWMRGIPSLA